MLGSAKEAQSLSVCVAELEESSKMAPKVQTKHRIVDMIEIFL